jgi:hypothetical protein
MWPCIECVLCLLPYDPNYTAPMSRIIPRSIAGPLHTIFPDLASPQDVRGIPVPPHHPTAGANPDEAVAIGASIQGGVLAGNVDVQGTWRSAGKRPNRAQSGRYRAL